MSLTPIESVNRITYFSTGVFSGGSHYRFLGGFDTPPLGGPVYVDRNDTLVYGGAQVSPEVKGLMQFDPRFLDNSAAKAKFATQGPNQATIIMVGEWDKVNGIQKIYGGFNMPPMIIYPIDQSTLVLDLGSPISPGTWPFYFDTKVGGTTGIGGWDDSATGSDTLFFETWGYALRIARCRHTDGILYRGLTLVDLTTGLGTLLDVPVWYRDGAADLFEHPRFHDDEFELNGLQFVADDDSQVAAPKGRIFLHSNDFLSDLGDVVDTDWRQWMKIIEWNPLDVSPSPGNPSRVHLRELLMTKLDFVQRQSFGTNENSTGDTIPPGGGFAHGELRARFHPPTRTFITCNDMGSSGERGYVRTSLAPALSQIQAPTALQEVETARTPRFRAKALGDIGEPIGGLPSTWALDRRSTIGEEFDTSSGTETYVDVANAPIDTGTLVFYYLGTPLTITTDYTVNEGTGRITGVGAHTPFNVSGYTADYRHATVGAQPPHGTLLQLTGRTDELGHTETRVEYDDDDDLESGLDFITCEISDD